MTARSWGPMPTRCVSPASSWTRYPLFANYLEKLSHYFANDWDYRTKVVPLLLADGFFWHLVVAHAWILHSQFHIDAGGQGDIQFYANNCNKHADWSDIASLKSANPYDSLPMWRAGEYPGEAAAQPVSRFWAAGGRCVDHGAVHRAAARPAPCDAAQPDGECRGLRRRTPGRDRAGLLSRPGAALPLGLAAGEDGLTAPSPQRMKASIAAAISRSPITTLSAPRRARCSVSASKWDRATMTRRGLARRACSTIWPASNASGMAT